MHFLELFLQRHFNHIPKVSQVHALLITTAALLSRPNTFIYNCLIKCHPESALLLFNQMLSHSTQPNSHTFPSLLKSTSSPSAAQSIHTQILRRGLLLDGFTNCCLVDLYARSGLLPEAKNTFEQLPHPDTVSCNSMLNAFCANGDVISALGFFRSLPEKDIVSWTTVINGLMKNGMHYEALDIFRSLLYNGQVRPNEATMVSVLSACANVDLCHGREIHGYIVRSESKLTAFLGTALIDFYGKHGRLSSSVSVFESVTVKEVCTWNALISALACNGEELKAVNFFNEMEQRCRPNHITFVAVLTACARGKLVGLGLALFESMRNDFGIVASMEHYGCIVDLLSRAGMTREAWELIRKMPVEPDASVLGALLGGCKVHGEEAMGTDVGKKAMELQPWNSGRYMLLANIFAEGGKWEAAGELRECMEKAGIRKIAGCTLLDSGKTGSLV